MGKNQSIYNHYYPKLEKNMVSKVRCTRGRIRNDDNSNAFLHILLSMILGEVYLRQMLSSMRS